jgi:hypothetical protein
VSINEHWHRQWHNSLLSGPNTVPREEARLAQLAQPLPAIDARPLGEKARIYGIYANLPTIFRPPTRQRR